MRRRGKRPPGGGGKPAGTPPQGEFSRTRDVPPSNLLESIINGFSMKDEARNTMSHHSGWAQNEKLRQRPVTFVSAGFTEPLKDMTAPAEQDATPEATADGGESERAIAEEVSSGEVLLQVSSLVETELRIEDGSPALSASIVQDDVVLETDNKLEPVNQPTAAPALFFFDLEGDKGTPRAQHPPARVPSPRSADESDSNGEIILFRGRSGNVSTNAQKGKPESSRTGQSRPKVTGPRESPLGRHTPQSKGKQAASSQSNPKTQAPRSKRPNLVMDSDENDDEDAILADYIANMAEDSDNDFLNKQVQPFTNQRDLGGDHHAFGIEALAEDGPSLAAEFFNEGKDPMTDSEEEEEEDSEDEDSDSELDDETLAKLLAKQQELGIYDDDLLIAIPHTGTRAGTSKTQLPGYRKQRSNARTSEVADAFNDLDLADWDQSKIWSQAKGKRRKQAPDFGVSDSEIETALKTAWERDRERKKNRKLEREALRAQGLLGKNVDPEDLRVKYQSGMHLDDMKRELVAFLMGSTETVQFPPMDKEARKILHELANKFKVKSQSTGSSTNRRPVLYRTKRTARFGENRLREVISQVDQAAIRINRKNFYRTDGKGKSIKSSSYGGRGGGGGGGGGGAQALTYRDGEIAGASVPVLGQENKGHAMMEKMGWSKGMALGTLENKGILEPVAQVIKRSKAGLG